MTGEIAVLAGTAATLGLIHTVLGPDHYVPFVAMARARNWGLARTAVVTALCGVGHVLSSIVLGFVGLFLGVAVFKLEAIESFRGNIAGWFLLAFGLVYLLWGLHRALRSRPHEHAHGHADGDGHSHEHSHAGDHSHAHAKPGSDRLTPWVLFTVFIFGPCEPLIPLIMYPAAKVDIAGVAIVALVFAATTIGTMLVAVTVLVRGLSRMPAPRLGRYSHALAGFSVLICGVAMVFLGA